MENEKNLLVLSADDILSSKVELAQELVELSGNRAVYVREMTGAEKNGWELACMKKVPGIGKQQPTMEMNLEDYRTKLLVFTVCDVNGTRLFDDKFLIPRNLKDLGSKFKASDLETIVDVANRLNKITEEDQEALLKNLETDQNDSSISGSV